MPWPRSYLLGLVCALAFGGGLRAQQPVSRPPDYDFHDSRTRVPPPEKPDTRFKAPDRTSAVSGVPSPRYSLRGPLTEARAGTPETIAREFLDRSSANSSAKRAFTPELPLVARFESKQAKLTHLVFGPAHAGIPFFDSQIRVHVDAEGRVWRADPLPSLAAPGSLATALQAADAIEAAAKSISPATQLDLTLSELEVGAERRVTYLDRSLLSPAMASLVWFPLGEEIVLAWQVEWTPVARPRK